MAVGARGGDGLGMVAAEEPASAVWRWLTFEADFPILAARCDTPSDLFRARRNNGGVPALGRGRYRLS